MTESGPTLLFVYGTLKRGGSNHPFLAGQTFVGHARTAAGYELYDLGGYPGMVPSTNGAEPVEGEVWSVDPAALSSLDDLEGVHEGLYRRERVALAAPFGDDEVQTYIYALSPEGRSRLGNNWTG